MQSRDERLSRDNVGIPVPIPQIRGTVLSRPLPIHDAAIICYFQTFREG